jgi:hypothetical protein
LLYAWPRNEAFDGRLAFETPAAVAFAFEFDQTAEAEQGGELIWLVEGAEHAGKVAGGGDLGRTPCPSASRLAWRRRSS